MSDVLYGLLYVLVLFAFILPFVFVLYILCVCSWRTTLYALAGAVLAGVAGRLASPHVFLLVEAAGRAGEDEAAGPLFAMLAPILVGFLFGFIGFFLGALLAVLTGRGNKRVSAGQYKNT